MKKPKLRASADYEVTRTGGSRASARITRGEGDAEAAKLFANAFSRDPDFYAFIRSLRAYEASFKDNRGRVGTEPGQRFLPLHEVA